MLCTYVIPQVLFVETFEKRQQLVWACCLAWNFGNLRDDRHREEQLAQVLDVMAPDMAGAPAGVVEAFATDLRALAEIKRDLFPWQTRPISTANLERVSASEFLRTYADGTSERIELSTNPQANGTPLITRTIAQMHRDTREQRHTLEEARKAPGLPEQLATDTIVTAYCAQRAHLRGYERMLTHWQGQLGPEFAEPLDRFRQAIGEIEADSKAVIAMLAAALGIGADTQATMR